MAVKRAPEGANNMAYGNIKSSCKSEKAITEVSDTNPAIAAWRSHRLHVSAFQRQELSSCFLSEMKMTNLKHFLID